MSSRLTRYGLIITVASWLVLSIIVIAAVQRNLSAPGLGMLDANSAFTIFEASVAVLRLTSVFWAMLAVLFLMLGIRRRLGTWPAIVSGVLLSLDPAWFFLGVLDRGAAIQLFFVDASLFILVRFSGRAEMRVVFWRRHCFSGSEYLTKLTC